MKISVICEFASAAEAIAHLSGTSAATVAAAVPAAAPSASDILAGQVRAFLEGDQSGYDWRSASAIAAALQSTADAVAAVATASNGLESRQSRGTLGVLVSLN